MARDDATQRLAFLAGHGEGHAVGFEGAVSNHQGVGRSAEADEAFVIGT